MASVVKQLVLSQLLIAIIAANVVLNHEGCMTPTRKKGLCVSIYDCPSMLTFYRHRPLSWEKHNFLRLSVCTGATPGGRQSFVCCPDKATGAGRPTGGSVGQPARTYPPPVIPSTVPSAVNPTPQGEVAGGVLPDPQRNECGISIGSRILGGEDADIYDFPWFALLEYENPCGQRNFSCGGSLVNNRYVVTAAHCVVGEIEKKEGKLISVRLGEHDTRTKIDCIKKDGWKFCADPPVNVGLEEKIPHPDYDAKRIENDIALLRLARDVLYTEFIQPICLPLPSFSSSVVGDEVVVTGFGKTLKEFRSPVKQKLGIKVYDQGECRAKFSEKKENITSKQLCAGGDYVKDTCYRDSGSPLMKLQKIWTLEGVVSFGNRCGLEDWPGVYSRVLAYMDWIRATVRN